VIHRRGDRSPERSPSRLFPSTALTQGMSAAFLSRPLRLHGAAGGSDMIRIAITQAAFDAIARTLPGNVGYENAVNEKGERLIRLERRMLDKLNSHRRPGESYSEVILRLVENGGERGHDSGALHDVY
jgi:hypothetical protein